jgi:hypothetical protein
MISAAPGPAHFSSLDQLFGGLDLGVKSSREGHSWAFKARFRSRAYGWRGSALASKRLKEAVCEIKAAARQDRLLAAEGIVSLMERLWPALQDIDTSSGALGTAVNHGLEELIPILISAPGNVGARAAWLERLYQAVMDDGVQYLRPVEDRWGELAVYPELMEEYADRLGPMIRRVWMDEPRGGYVTGMTICFSCLLEIGRYGDLIELLACSPRRWWDDHRFGAEALARQGLWDAAIAYAEGCRDPHGYDDHRIDRFCEHVLIKSGRTEEAYRRYGLKAADGLTYLSIFRELAKRYPGIDRRKVLLDLIEARGNRGKWFAPAKDAGFLDLALECARAPGVEPATLVRAARDFASKNPPFALEVGLIALKCLLNGGGYDPDVSLVQATIDHIRDAASRIGKRDWARLEAQSLVEGQCVSSFMQRALAEALSRWTI